MTERAKDGKRPQIQATVDRALFECIKSEAMANFDSVSGIVEARLVASYAAEVTFPKTALADTKEKSAAADLELKELRLKQLRKELIHVEDAVRVVEKVFGEMRVSGRTLMADFAREYNLDADTLERRFLTTMAGQFEVEREPYQQLAEDFSRQQLP